MGRGAAIGLGLLAGGLFGAAARPAVVYAFWLRGADADLSEALLLASAVIGLVIGFLAVALASLIRTTWGASLLGAILGAGLAYLCTALTFLPLFWCGLLGISGVQAVGEEAPLYGVAMALTGALAGGGGAFLQDWLSGTSRSRPGLPEGPG
jgi:hypothetical protein